MSNIVNQLQHDQQDYMKKVYCIGELLIDFVAEKQGYDLSKATVFTKKAGGAPANVACSINKLGGKGVFVGCIGKDPFGDFLLQTLDGSGVDTSLAQRSETFTTLAFVSIAADGERDFVFSRGADRELQYDPSLKSDFGGNILHFGAATSFLGGGLENAYTRYLEDGLSKNSFISFDPNFRADLWQNKEAAFIDKCLPFIRHSQLCKFSLEEALLLSGKNILQEACAYLHDKGAKLITVTLGAEGTYVSTPTANHTIPSIKVRPVDTTGAGDAFIGCLLQQIAALPHTEQVYQDNELLVEMVRRANIAGALTTTRFGAIESLPDNAQLEAYL